MSAKISVIVPVYNVEKYLEQCVESILCQTFSDLEIILVDDGSTDSCPAKCDSYADADPRIRVIHKKNGGLSSARNAGLDVACGEYFAFVDSDDCIAPDMLETLLKTAQENDCDLVKCSFERFSSLPSEADISADSGRVRLYTSKDAVLSFLNDAYSGRKAFPICVWNGLYKSSLFLSLRFPEGLLYEDGYYSPQVFIMGERFAHIDKTMYFYRQNNASIIGSGITAKSLKSIDDWEFIYTKIKAKFPIEANYAIERWCRKLVDTYDYILFHPEIDEGGKYKKHIFEKVRLNNELFLDHISDNILANKVVLLSQDSEKYDRRVLNSDSFESGVKKYISQAKKHLINLKVLLYFIYTFRRRIINCPGNYFKKLLRKQRVVFLIGTPDHNNIGDHAITLGEIRYLKENFSDEIREFFAVRDYNEAKMQRMELKSLIKKKDLIFLHGGGNFGDLYQSEENYRRKIISAFPNNKIILFPSTMFFSDTPAGRAQLRLSSEIYCAHKNLTLLLRDKTSLENAEKNFKPCKMLLCPDMATYLIGDRDYSSSGRSGIMLCLRGDKESLFSAESREKYLSILRESHTVDEKDNAFYVKITKENREDELERHFDFTAAHSLVITDRYHGVIIAALTRTPCISLPCSNHKVAEGSRWFASTGAVRFENDIDSAFSVVDEMMGAEYKEMPDFKGTIKEILSEACEN